MTEPDRQLRNSVDFVDGTRPSPKKSPDTYLDPGAVDEAQNLTDSIAAEPPGKQRIANVSTERTLADPAYAAIYAAITDGTFAPGDRLRIEELSATLQISPTPIREALSRLESAGLAEHVPHRGSRVTLASVSEFRELYELRFILEPLAVAKAAERFSAGSAKEARTHLQQLRAAMENKVMAEAWQAHAGFHFTLYRAAQSRWLERLITPLWDSSRRYRVVQDNRNLEESGAEHESILQACIDHKPARASLELYNHVARNANFVASVVFGQPMFELKVD